VAYATLVLRALQGQSRDSLLAPQRPAETAGPSGPAASVVAVQSGAWRTMDDPIGEGSVAGDALGMLRLVYGALSVGESFKESVLAAVNAGLASDVAGAATGALAGAIHGAAAIPGHWLAALIDRDLIEQCADRLLVAALLRLMDETPAPLA
jgi:ADP-ribosyl-[dinitrogen reductase] hydrolase